MSNYPDGMTSADWGHVNGYEGPEREIADTLECDACGEEVFARFDTQFDGEQWIGVWECSQCKHENTYAEDRDIATEPNLDDN